MGNMLQAKCKCGFETDLISAGGGMMDFTTNCSLPALCKNCKTFTVENYLDKSSKCSICESSFTYYNSTELYQMKKNIKKKYFFYIFEWNLESEKIILPDALYYCPECNKYKMKFLNVGNWD